MHSLAGALLAAALMSACGGDPVGTINRTTTTYDGWRVGALETCPLYPTLPSPPSTELSNSECEANLAAWLGVGRDGFDRRDPNHASIVRATLHDLDTTTFHSARCCDIAVFELADGSIRAIGINLVVFPVKQADGTLRMSSANNAIDYGPDK
jgi:hypothetical protein